MERQMNSLPLIHRGFKNICENMAGGDTSYLQKIRYQPKNLNAPAGQGMTQFDQNFRRGKKKALTVQVYRDNGGFKKKALFY